MGCRRCGERVAAWECGLSGEPLPGRSTLQTMSNSRGALKNTVTGSDRNRLTGMAVRGFYPNRRLAKRDGECFAGLNLFPTATNAHPLAVAGNAVPMCMARRDDSIPYTPSLRVKLLKPSGKKFPASEGGRYISYSGIRRGAVSGVSIELGPTRSLYSPGSRDQAFFRSSKMER